MPNGCIFGLPGLRSGLANPSRPRLCCGGGRSAGAAHTVPSQLRMCTAIEEPLRLQPEFCLQTCVVARAGGADQFGPLTGVVATTSSTKGTVGRQAHDESGAAGRITDVESGQEFLERGGEGELT